jgi:hypothetical protein
MKAKKLGMITLWSHTPNKEDFYARLGWMLIEMPIYFDMPVVIMMKALD